MPMRQIARQLTDDLNRFQGQITDEFLDSMGPRFTHWAAFFIYSSVTLVSAFELYQNPDKNTSPETHIHEKRALAYSAVNFTLTSIVVLLHTRPVSAAILVGTKIEGFILLVLSAFWAAAVAIISDTKHGIAVSDTGMVTHGNLYYFSWAGFVCCVTLLVSFLRSVFGVDFVGETESRAARLNHWSALFATAMVVAGSSTNIFKYECLGKVHNGTDSFCIRTMYGIALGSTSSFMALMVVFMKFTLSKVPYFIEAVYSYILVPAYILGVVLITSQAGPGAPLGNLYYFTWISFVLTFILAASCTEDSTVAKRKALLKLKRSLSLSPTQKVKSSLPRKESSTSITAPTQPPPPPPPSSPPISTIPEIQ